MKNIDKYLVCLVTAFWCLMGTAPLAARTTNVLTINGNLQYQWNKKHFSHVNPDAPKGGTLNLYARGGFDAMNPYIARGMAAAGMSLTFDTLGVAAPDYSALEYYGLVAESFEVPEDKSHVIFHLRPEARFHDHSPMTAGDVAFTFHLLTEKGAPTYAQYYGSVKSVDVLSASAVRFNFTEKNNAELPVILAQLPVLSKRYWRAHDFSTPGLTPPLGSGPYQVKAFAMGSYISYERVKDYWGKDLPVNRGRYNMDQVRYEYYRDTTVARQAFKAGEFDLFPENTAKAWATAYTGDAVAQGRIVRLDIPTNQPQGIYGFMFNTRRPVFSDMRVRQALGLAFDFEWTNQRLFYNAYARCDSYFTNSPFAAHGKPSEGEIALLSPFKTQLPESVFAPAMPQAPTAGTGDIRPVMKQALGLFAAAGYHLDQGRLKDRQNRALKFSILVPSASLSRVVLPFKKNLERLGVTADIQMADPNQYMNRIRTFDFDMILGRFPGSSSPGNELRYFLGSRAADIPGSKNYPGIRSPVVDALIEKVVEAPSREALITRCRALDRVLRTGYYMIPGWYSPARRVAFWDKFGRSSVQAPKGLDIHSWWIDPGKLEKIRQSKTGYKH